MKLSQIILLSLAYLFSFQTQAAEMKLLGWDTDALQTRIDLIKNAKEEILAEYFEIYGDATTMVALGLLQEAADRGVKVKLLVDSMHNDISRAQHAAVTNELNFAKRSKNFEIKVFNASSKLRNIKYISNRNHDKLFVVDGKFAIIGGRNVSGSYFGRGSTGKANFRDVDVLTYGTEVKENQIIDGQEYLSPRNYFMELWEKNKLVTERDLHEYSNDRLTGDCYLTDIDKPDQCHAMKAHAIKQILKQQDQIDSHTAVLNSNKGAPNSTSRWLSTRPISEAQIRRSMRQVDIQFIYNDPTAKIQNVQNKVQDQLINLLESIQPKQLTIVTPYLFPPQATLSTLKRLKEQNNTRIKIITNSLNSTDSTLVHAGFEKVKPELLSFTSELYEYRGPLNKEKQPNILHAKFMILDEESEKPTIVIGSFNLDYRSAYVNREVLVKITGKDIKQLTEDILGEVDYIQRACDISDATNALDLNAPAEKQKKLEDAKSGPILKWLYKHI